MPHETYGSHLNNNGQTIDKELELKNFEAAGNTLADIWRNLVIDGHPVLAEYIPTPPPPLIKQFTMSVKYKSLLSLNVGGKKMDPKFLMTPIFPSGKKSTKENLPRVQCFEINIHQENFVLLVKIQFLIFIIIWMGELRQNK